MLLAGGFLNAPHMYSKSLKSGTTGKVKGRTGRGAIDYRFALPFPIGKSNQLKLRTAYPCGLNNRTENKDQCKSGK